MILALLPLFFVVSLIYSSVGFAGGSSYTAILVLAGVSLYDVSLTSLLLNIIVSTVAFINYLRAGHFSLKFSLPFLSSVPFAFIGGQLAISEKNLILIFSIALLVASVALVLSSRRAGNKQYKTKSEPSTPRFTLLCILAGIVLGLVAGITGIGGGICLSPLLILGGLAEPKRASATCSFFILTNSISGFLSRSISRSVDFASLLPLAFAVLIGGIIGSRFGAFKLSREKIKLIVAAVVAVAGISLLSKLFA